MKLELGRVVITAGANNLVAEDTDFAKHVVRSFSRYRAHDWGDLCAEDRVMNDKALASGEDRIFAAYEYPNRPEWKIWIITEWGRSATTILFPSEY